MDDLQKKVEELEKIILQLRQRIEKLEGAHRSSPPILTKPALPEKKKITVEELEKAIGTRWLNYLGILAVVVGVTFFLKFAFDNQWLGPKTRIWLGAFAGIGFVASGEFFNRKLPSPYYLSFIGGGLALLYSDIFAAFYYYQFISQPFAFTLLAFITAIAGTQAIRHNSYPIAFLGIISGYLTPFLLGRESDQTVALFSYVFILNIGVFTTSSRKNWKSLNLWSFWFTSLTLSYWSIRYFSDEKFFITVFFLAVFYILFSFLSIYYNLRNKIPATRNDFILIFFNNTLYFSATIGLLQTYHPAWSGTYTLVLALFNFGLGWWNRSKNNPDRFLTYLFWGLSAVFLTIAIPVQWKQDWISVGWSVEATILIYLGFRFLNPTTRLLGNIIFFGILYDILYFWTFNSVEIALVIFNQRTLAYWFAISGLAVSGQFYTRFQTPREDWEKHADKIMPAFAILLLMGWINLEVIKYYQIHSPADWHISSTKNLMVSVYWILLGLIVLVAGVVKKQTFIRFAALGVFGITVFKIIFVDLENLEMIYKILIFLGIGLVFMGISWWYQRKERI